MAAGLAGQAAKSRGRSRHGTAIDRLADGVALVGRHRTPPDARVQQLAALIEVGAKQSHGAAHFASTAIRVEPGGREGEHLARGPVPPPCSPSCSPRTWTAERASICGALIQLRIELAIQLAIGSSVPSGDSTRAANDFVACDLGADNGSDKRGVSNPRTGSGTGDRAKQGGCSRPGSTADGDQRRLARGTERRACERRRDICNLQAPVTCCEADARAPRLAREVLARRLWRLRFGRQPPRFVAAPLAASAVRQ